MIRKSHSWSLTWARDKSADQSGPFIVSLPSGQSVPRAFSSRFALRTSRHGGQSQSKQPQAHHAGVGYISHFEPPFAIVRKSFVLFHLLLRSSTIFSPLPRPPRGGEGAAGRSWPHFVPRPCSHDHGHRTTDPLTLIHSPIIFTSTRFLLRPSNSP